MTIVKHPGQFWVGTSTEFSGISTTNLLSNTFFHDTTTNRLFKWDGAAWILPAPYYSASQGSYTIYKDGTTVKARNNHTGVVDFSHASDIGNVINSCIGALPSTLSLPTGSTVGYSGGGTIYITNDLQGGVTTRYDLGTKIVVNKHNVKLVQEAGSVIYPTAAFASDVIVTKSAHYFTAEDLYIDCSRMTVGTGSIIVIGEVAFTDKSDHAMIHRCKLYNPPKSGILITGSSNASWIVDNRIQSCFASVCSNSHGIWLQSSSDHIVRGNQVGGFVATSCAAILVQACATVGLHSNEIFSSYHGIYLYDDRDVLVDSNFLQHFANHGIVIVVDDTPTVPYSNIKIVNNRVTGCSSTGVAGGVSNTADSLFFFLYPGETFNNLTIQNNTLADELIESEGHTTLTQRRSINLSVEAGSVYKNSLVTGNTCYANQTGGVSGAILPYSGASGPALSGVAYGHNIGREIPNS